MKLINNLLAATNLASVGEALSIAKAWGVDPVAAAASVSGATGGSRVSSAMYPNWILSGTHDSGFTMGLMARDVALAIEVGAEMGLRPRLSEEANAVWQESLSELGRDADFTEIAYTVAPSITKQKGMA